MSDRAREFEERGEKNALDLYESIMRYQKRGREVDKTRIIQATDNIFLVTNKTYGLFKDTLLTAALNAGLQEAALKLAGRGARANIGHINQEGDYALLLACKYKFKDVALELLKHQGNPCSPNENDETPLSFAVSDVDMNAVAEKIIGAGICDNVKNEMIRILEIGNYEAFNELLKSPQLDLESYNYEMGHKTIKLTLLEYIYATTFGPDYTENHQHARALLEKTGIRCNPLHISKTNKISALMFVVGDTGTNADDAIFVITKILEFAESERNGTYVDFKNKDGFAAFDLIFHNAMADGTNIDIRILKLFIDYYYKNNPNSDVFLRNIPYMCNEPELFNALKNLYPESKRELLDNACNDVVGAEAGLVHPIIRTPSPGIQTAKRTTSKRKESAVADEIPIVNALTPVSPLPLWAQVDDPHEIGIRQPKPYSPTRNGGKGEHTKTKQIKRRGLHRTTRNFYPRSRK